MIFPGRLNDLGVRFTAVDLEFRDLGNLEEEKAFSAADADFEVAALVAADGPAVGVGRLKAVVAGPGLNGLPDTVIIAYLQLNVGGQEVNAEDAGGIHGKGAYGLHASQVQGNGCIFSEEREDG